MTESHQGPDSGPVQSSSSLESAFTYSPDSWPQTFEGVTDWEKIFEHPEAGFIPYVTSARNLVELKQAVLICVKKLFTRKTDREEVACFLGSLEIIFTDGDFDDTRDATVVLFRHIKELRIQKTEEYLERRREGWAEERRAHHDDQSGLTLSVFKHIGLNKSERRFFFRAMAAAIAIVVVGFSALFGLNYYIAQSEIPQVQTIEAKPTSAAPSPVVMDKVTKLAQAEEIEIADDPRPYDFKVSAPAIFLTVRPDGKRSYRALFQPTLYLTSDEESMNLCRNWPLVLDALHQVLYRVHPRQEPPSERHLHQANRLATKVINNSLGGDLIQGVSYAPTQDLQKAAFASPRSCKFEKVKVG